MTSSVHRQEVLLKSLPTRSVTFYPSRALINREIPNIELKYGANEIEIYGLTPTADEHSIKVDGFGAASVTDMTVDLVPNRETFAQVYPDDMDYDDSETETEDEDGEAGSEEVKDCLTYIIDMKRRIDRERMISSDLQDRSTYLNNWYSSLEGKDAVSNKVADLLNTFHDENVKLSDQLKLSLERMDQLMKDESRAQKKLRNLTKEARRKERKESIQKAKKTLQERSEKDSASKVKQRIREERAKYFPKKVYKVTIHFEVPVETPGTSRRSSVSSVTIIKNQDVGDGDTPDAVTSIRANLQLSYITLDASWAPRYDIEFATTQRSGKISYRAQFTNFTSETWEQTKVSLSTSQASFRGLEDQVPWMRWWRIGLTKHNTGPGALTSFDERNAQLQGPSQAYHPSSEHRAELFGIDQESASYKREFDQEVKKKQVAAELGELAKTKYSDIAPSRRTAQTAGSSHARMASQPGQGAFRARKIAPPSHGVLAEDKENDEDEEEDQTMGFGIFDAHAHPRVDFEDATWEDHGLTTTYDIPNSRTIEPSSLTRRHKIASLPFSNLILTSIAVPKLRQAAFLRARFRNPSSSITLLKGTAGLTLDGTFLGNTTLPRVSPGELITLPLGVDPALHISYARPVVKRSTHGVFNKESAQVFSRSIVVTNTKSVAAELLVLDQIPISEDEKLRVEIIEPRGVTGEGATVSTGVNAQAGKCKWGSAKATLKKHGEIAFNVLLEKGAAARLAVEYEARAPTTDTITSK